MDENLTFDFYNEMEGSAPAMALAFIPQEPALSKAARVDQRRLLLLEGQSRILEYIAKGASIDRSLDCVAEVVEQIASPARCSIMLLDRFEGRLRSVAAPSLPEDFRSAIAGVKIGPGGLPCSLAASRREPVVVSDLAREPRWAHVCELAKDHGIAASWSQPILDQFGDVLGVMTLFYEFAYEPTGEDFRLVDAMGPITRIAIEHDSRARALKSANNRFKRLAANVPGVVYQRIVTPDGDIRYTYISEGARELFGVSPEEIVNDPNALFNCHGPEYRKTFRQRLIAASNELTMWDVEAPIITRDGRRKWTHAIARPQRQPDGSVLWDGIILDATRIKEANLQLEASNRAKSEFLANMSHELRTPLNAIIGFSEIMNGEVLGPLGDPSYKQYAGDINSSGRHLLSVINDILDLSKIEAGTLDLDEDRVETQQIVEDSIRLIAERAGTNKVCLSVTLEDDLPELSVDERKIKQVLLNVLSNAVKFAPGGNVGIHAGLTPLGDLAIAVSDDGIGIDGDHVDRVFEPFVQAESGLSRNFDGTGLGLPIAKRMIELHGGSISLESRHGAGTVVTVVIPRNRFTEAVPKATVAA